MKDYNVENNSQLFPISPEDRVWTAAIQTRKRINASWSSREMAAMRKSQTIQRGEGLRSEETLFRERSAPL